MGKVIEVKSTDPGVDMTLVDPNEYNVLVQMVEGLTDATVPGHKMPEEVIGHLDFWAKGKMIAAQNRGYNNGARTVLSVLVAKVKKESEEKGGDCVVGVPQLEAMLASLEAAIKRGKD